MVNYWELKKKLPSAKNQEAVEEYLLSLKVAQRSRLTIIRYRWFLERFFEKREEAFSELTSDMILGWFIQNEGHLKETSLKFRLSVLSSFFSFCVKDGILDRSPMKSRWSPRLPQPIPKYLEKGDVAKARKLSESNSLRNRALFEFMLVTGCRVGEVHNLNLENIDFENRSARVFGKGNKIREVHFTEKCAVLLEGYLRTRPRNVPALFLTRNFKRLSIRRIQSILNELGEKAELTGGLYPHRLRHTFATELLAKGGDLSFIGDELGHRDLKITQIYARLPKGELITMYRKYMG